MRTIQKGLQQHYYGHHVGSKRSRGGGTRFGLVDLPSSRWNIAHSNYLEAGKCVSTTLSDLRPHQAP